MKYCWLVEEIASRCFKRNAPMMKGDYGKALRQQIMNGDSLDATPMHILLNHSDAVECQLTIVKDLIEENIISAVDFSTYRDFQVDLCFIHVSDVLHCFYLARFSCTVQYFQLMPPLPQISVLYSTYYST